MRSVIFFAALISSSSLLFPRFLLSQELPLRHYTTEKEVNPLPSTAVTTVFQDKEGYIWIALYGNSLVRYDGVKMELFTGEDGLHTAFWSIQQDRSGRLWIGADNGLRVTERSLFDYAPGERPSFVSQLDSVTLMNGRIVNRTQLLGDSRGRIWSASGGLVVRYEYDEKNRLLADTIVKNDLPKEAGQNIYGLTERQNGHILAITNTNRLLEFEADGNNYRSTPVLMDAPEGRRHLTLHLLEDNDGTLWGARLDGLLWRIVSRDSVYRTEVFPARPNISLTPPIALKNGRFLMGSVGGGLIEWQRERPEDFRIYSISNGLLNPVIWDVMQDREGNVWLATNAGLSRMPGDYPAFGHYTSNASGEAPNMLPEDGVNTVQVDVRWSLTPGGPPEKLIVAGTGQGLSMIRSDGSREFVQVEQGLLSNAVLGLHQDHLGRLWVAGREGVACLSPDPALLDLPGFSKPVVHKIWNTPVYLSHLAMFLIVDAVNIDLPTRDGAREKISTVWLVGPDQMLCLLDRQWYHFWKNTGVGSTMRTLAADDRGYLYLADLNQGFLRSRSPVTGERLLSFETKNGTSPRLEQLLGVQDSVFHPYLLMDGGDTITQAASIRWFDDLKVMWTGTTAGGYFFRSGDRSVAGKVVPRDTSASLFFQSMTAAGDESVIWFGTRSGLVAADAATGELLRTVNKSNGLVDNQNWGYSSLDMNSEGVLYWGTPKGLSIYRPAWDDPDTVAPRLVFRQFNLKQDDWGNNELVIEFAGLSFYDEKGVQYQTRLGGYDPDWSELGTDTRIRYTNLPAFLFPKTYTFSVKARNVHGIWVEEHLSHPVSILPPIWLRWYVALGVLTLMSLLIWFFVKWRTRKQEAALTKERQVSEQLRQVDALKDQFLANTSHELRTPLNGIIGLSESLAIRTSDSEIKSDLELIISSGRRLANLVNDILDFSKLKNDQLHLQLNPVDLHALTDVILTLTYPLLGDKPLQLNNQIPEDIPLVEADENRVQQILHNLIGNAVKFTPEGEVNIHSEVKEQMVEITVSDTGIGIAPEKLDSIFRAFEQADGSTARLYGGTGLGLAVTRQLVETHGGQIWVTSTQGKGSDFTFSLPISQASREEINADTRKRGRPSPKIPQLTESSTIPVPLQLKSKEEILTAPLSGIFRILIVDDEPINLQVLKNHLSAEGYQVTTAGNGMRALDILRSGQQFDLIILDVMMPRMSGYEVCQELRDIFLPSELPVVMLTAKNRVTDLIDGFNAGANDYLTKPFSRDELLSRIKTHLRLHRINRATSKFVPNEFLRSIGRETITEVQLGDLTKREVTVFFSDIRSFTSLIETMTPEEAFKFVNAYNRRIGPIIQQHDGFVNQYLGDGIMALFMGSKSDALEAAIQMQKTIDIYNEQRKKQDRLPIRVGMGLHVGPLIMGVIGDQNRLNPAIVADTVNTASRIENLTKHYGVRILLSEDILAGIDDRSAFHLRPLGKFLLKGKQEPVAIYECFDGDPPDVFERKQQTLQAFEEGVACFYSRRFEEARRAFEQVLAVVPEDEPARLFLNKTEALLRDGVPADWNGVERMMVK